jgi:two-component system, NtrC family, response regulator AtoC
VSRSARDAPGRPVLLVLGSEGRRLQTVALPAEGEVVLGRGDDCFVRLTEPSVSRRHARLHLGEALSIEDLGSGNGTFVVEPPLSGSGPGEATRRTDLPERQLAAGERAPLSFGSIVKLGAQTLVLERAEATEPRRLWSHAHLVARLEQICGRAGEVVSLLRLKFDPVEQQRVIEWVLAASRADEVVACPAAGEIEISVAGDRERAIELLARLEEALAGAGIAVAIGIVHCPEHGRDAHALVAQSAAAVGSQHPARAVVVADPTMRELHARIERVAQSTMPVLLLGETGAGKEVLAEAVHRASPRAEKPFFCLNCGALSETLLESELFGHEKGAFTGAHRSKLGLLEAAGGGSVFLDEIGELPSRLQVKLLRVLENRTLLRVGSVRPTSIDVRFIAATNRDLEQDVAAGGFRADLYFRIAAVTLRIPPLRERPQEIEALARHFLSEAARQCGRWPEPELDPAALDVMRRHAWPGNVRELKNVIECALLVCPGDRIEVAHLPLDQMRAAGETLAPSVTRRPTLAPPPPRPELIEPEGGASERERILSALEECAGNQTRAAKLLGISRRTLVSRLGHYNLPRPRK